ncbi:MAG: CRISPR-associated endonuclease Cas3'', partial [Bacteroidetes bacterium]
MTEIISHPGKPLIVHLREVARFCAQTLECKSLELGLSPEVLYKLGFLQGAVHDIGKATRNFQTYIRSGGKIVNPPKHHALISAFVAKQIADEMLNREALADTDKKVLPYFLFTSVKRHHGNVLNFIDELEGISNKEEDLKCLTENFYDEEVQTILDELLAEIDWKYDWQEFKKYMRGLEDVFYEFEDFTYTMEDMLKGMSDLESARYFYLHHLLFSSLLLSDKTDVKTGSKKPGRADAFNYDAVVHYRRHMKWDQPAESEIARLKNQAYSEGLENLGRVFRKDRHLYSLTLPTGLGKTVTSLAIAMKLKKMLEVQNPRIIITIPFTSIIDQNYEVFEAIFDRPGSDILLKHHHLAEPEYKIDE